MGRGVWRVECAKEWSRVECDEEWSIVGQEVAWSRVEWYQE